MTKKQKEGVSRKRRVARSWKRKNRFEERSRLTEYRFRRFVHAFAEERTIKEAAAISGLSENSTSEKIRALRTHVVEQSLKAPNHYFHVPLDRLTACYEILVKPIVEELSLAEWKELVGMLGHSQFNLWFLKRYPVSRKLLDIYRNSIFSGDDVRLTRHVQMLQSAFAGTALDPGIRRAASKCRRARDYNNFHIYYLEQIIIESLKDKSARQLLKSNDDLFRAELELFIGTTSFGHIIDELEEWSHIAVFLRSAISGEVAPNLVENSWKTPALLEGSCHYFTNPPRSRASVDKLCRQKPLRLCREEIEYLNFETNRAELVKMIVVWLWSWLADFKVSGPHAKTFEDWIATNHAEQFDLLWRAVGAKAIHQPEEQNKVFGLWSLASGKITRRFVLNKVAESYDHLDQVFEELLEVVSESTERVKHHAAIAYIEKIEGQSRTGSGQTGEAVSNSYASGILRLLADNPL